MANHTGFTASGVNEINSILNVRVPIPSSMAPFTDKLWLEDDKLIIGIDIGTTFTAVSYAHLYKSESRTDPSSSCHTHENIFQTAREKL